jgi:hypothetical protein
MKFPVWRRRREEELEEELRSHLEMASATAWNAARRPRMRQHQRAGNSAMSVWPRR